MSQGEGVSDQIFSSCSFCLGDICELLQFLVSLWELPLNGSSSSWENTQSVFRLPGTLETNVRCKHRQMIRSLEKNALELMFLQFEFSFRSNMCFVMDVQRSRQFAFGQEHSMSDRAHIPEMFSGDVQQYFVCDATCGCDKNYYRWLSKQDMAFWCEINICESRRWDILAGH